MVSSVLKNRDPETVILFVAAQPDFEWIVSTEILAEYKEVLSRKKFALPEEIKHQWFEMLDALTTVVKVDLTIDFPRDQKDAKFLECALITNADFFITGDRDFAEAQRLINTTVISVSLFKRLVCDALYKGRRSPDSNP